MLRQALDAAFDCLSNVGGRFGARSPLGNTTGECRTRGYEHSVLVLFQVDTILHHPAFYQSGKSLPAFAKFGLGDYAESWGHTKS